MHTCIKRGREDPFDVRTERKLDAKILASALSSFPKAVRRDDGLGEISFPDPVVNKIEPIGGTRYVKYKQRNKQGFIERLSIALIGGAFVIAPMLLMVLHKTQTTALVSTSVAVVLCGIVAAWWLPEPVHVISTTAAYAAVMVVFVGTNNAN